MQNTLTGFVSTLHPLTTSNALITPINVTATATAEQMIAGVITSTSAAAVAITTPTAAAICNALGIGAGSYYEFIIDNTAGANTVTLTLDASITAESAVTGGTTLTVSSGHTGHFKVYFYSTTAAKIARLA